MRNRWITAAAIAVLAGSLGACVTPTPYQPRVAGARVGGYSETRVDASRWRVRFSGNTATSRERVERYLLYRAAELTLQQGGEWFEVRQPNTETRSRYFAQHDAFYDAGPGQDFGWGWRPQWSYYSPSSGWRVWDPMRDKDIWSGEQGVWETHRYIATAEIVVGSGSRPADRRVFDARQLVAELGRSIERPAG